MAFQQSLHPRRLWEGEMTEVEVDGHEMLLVWPEGGEVQAYQGVCPHQDIPLSKASSTARC